MRSEGRSGLRPRRASKKKVEKEEEVEEESCLRREKKAKKKKKAKVRELIAHPRDGSGPSWLFTFGEAVEPSSVVQFGHLEETEDGRAEVLASDAVLLDAAKRAIALGASIVSFGESGGGKTKRLLSSRERESPVEALGHELARCVSYCELSDVAALAQTNHAARSLVVGSVTELTMTTSRFFTVLGQVLPDPRRLVALDLTAYAWLSHSAPASLPTACPALERLALRQEYGSGRDGDKTDFYDFVSRVQRRGWAGRRDWRDSRRAFVRDALLATLEGFAASGSLRELSLFVADTEWFRMLSSAQLEDERDEEDSETEMDDEMTHLAATTTTTTTTTRAGTSEQPPFGLELRSLRVECMTYASRWGDEQRFDICLRASDVRRLLSPTSLRRLVLGSSVRLAPDLVDLLTAFDRLEDLRAPRLFEISAKSPLYSARAAVHFAVDADTALKRRAALVAGRRDLVRLDVDVPRARFRSPMNLGRRLGAHDDLAVALSEMEVTVKQALNDCVASCVRTKVKLLALSCSGEDTTTAADGASASWAGRAYENNKVVDADVADARLDPTCRALRLAGRLAGRYACMADFALLVQSTGALALAPHLAHLVELKLDRVDIFPRRSTSAEPNRLDLSKAANLRTIEIKEARNVDECACFALPRLRAFKFAHSGASYYVDHGLDSIRVGPDCPNLETLVVDVGGLRIKPTDRPDSRSVVLAGSLDALTVLTIKKTERKGSHAIFLPRPSIATLRHRQKILVPLHPDDPRRASAAAASSSLEDATGTTSASEDDEVGCAGDVDAPSASRNNVDVKPLLDKHFANWWKKLEACEPSPRKCLDLARELADENNNDDENDEEVSAAKRAARDFIRTTALQVRRAHLSQVDCFLKIDDSQSHLLEILRVKSVDLEVSRQRGGGGGGGAWPRLSPSLLDLSADGVDDETATALFKAVAKVSATLSNLRKLELWNFEATGAKNQAQTALTLPPTLRHLVLVPGRQTKALALKAATTVEARLIALQIGGDGLKTVSLSGPISCRELKLETPKLPSTALDSICAAIPSLTTLELCACKALQDETTISHDSLEELCVESCLPIKTLVVQAKKLHVLEIAKLKKLEKISIRAPQLRDLTIDGCTRLANDAIDAHTSSTFDCLTNIHVSMCKQVGPSFFQFFASSKKRNELHITMQSCCPAFKPRGATKRSTVELTETELWTTMCAIGARGAAPY